MPLSGDTSSLEARIAILEAEMDNLSVDQNTGFMTAPWFDGDPNTVDYTHNLAFDCFIKSNTIIAVNPGVVYVARNKSVKVPTAYTQTDVIVSGAGWVYLRIAKADPANNAFAFLAGSALPNAQSSSDWNIPIAELEVVGGNIQIVEPQAHRGACIVIGAGM